MLKKVGRVQTAALFHEKNINWHLAYVMSCSCSIPPIFWGTLPETNELVSSENMPQSAPRKWSIFQAIGIWAKHVYTPKNLHKPQKIAGFRSMTIPFRLKNGPFPENIRCFFGGLSTGSFRKGNSSIPPDDLASKWTTLLGITMISSCQMVVGRVQAILRKIYGARQIASSPPKDRSKQLQYQKIVESTNYLEDHPS